MPACFSFGLILTPALAVTSWSSTREPEKVLILLETLYNAFDQIAMRMGVYKGACVSFRLCGLLLFSSALTCPCVTVETIGDVSCN